MLGPLTIRVQAGQLLKPADIAESIQNFEITEEGTLLSTRGPSPYVPDYGQGYPSYQTMHGVFHATLQNGARDVLLCHTGPELWVLNGWSQSWEALVSTAGGAQVEETLFNSDQPQFPTQFEATPTGIVIIPQGTTSPKAFFYDGEVVGRLGYPQKPSPPNILGPASTSTGVAEDNNTYGYSVTHDTMNASTGAGGGYYHWDFGKGRIGTVDTSTAFTDTSGVDPSREGHLLQGKWRGAVQWVDRWGNLSPVSDLSGEVIVQSRPGGADSVTNKPSPIEWLQHQFFWTNIAEGPGTTRGRILFRTKDMINSGTHDLFEMTMGGESGNFATLPDNISQDMPDNVPDAWLLKPPTQVQPVPPARLCRMAMGRLWIANTSEEPGILIPSIPGMWGTFAKNAEMFPDPSGAEITGLWNIPGGLLAFTADTSYIVQPSQDGTSFRSATLHPTLGCVAPSSIRTMPTGETIWLSRKGFIIFDGKNIANVSSPVQKQMRRINPARSLQAVAEIDHTRGEYICWVPMDNDTTNNHAFVFDGTGWRERTNENVVAVARTRDHRQYIIAAGKEQGTDGIWLLDHENQDYTPAAKTFTIETAWLSSEKLQRTSAFTLRLWLRETHTTGQATVDVYTNWREGSSPDHSVTVDLDSPEDTPPSWSTTLLGAAGAEWVRRRPYWIRKDIAVHSAETFKLKISSTTPMEFISLAIVESVHRSRRTPRSN